MKKDGIVQNTAFSVTINNLCHKEHSTHLKVAFIKKEILISFLFALILHIISCNESSVGSNSVNLPESFPLTKGNAWIYERHNYINETMYLDTLYIFDTFGQLKDQFYKYSWEPDLYYDIVKNEDNKLLNYGRVDGNISFDTSLNDKPCIWTFYNIKPGIINTDSLSQIYDLLADSIEISIESMVKAFNGLFAAYVTREIYEIYFVEAYITEAGFSMFRNTDIETNEVTAETIGIKRLSNFYPPMNTRTKKTTTNVSNQKKRNTYNSPNRDH